MEWDKGFDSTALGVQFESIPMAAINIVVFSLKRWELLFLVSPLSPILLSFWNSGPNVDSLGIYQLNPVHGHQVVSPFLCNDTHSRDRIYRIAAYNSSPTSVALDKQDVWHDDKLTFSAPATPNICQWSGVSTSGLGCNFLYLLLNTTRGKGKETQDYWSQRQPCILWNICCKSEENLH